MASAGGSWKSGKFSAKGGAADLEQQSRELRASISAKGSEPVSGFTKGDMFLMNNNVVRISKISPSYVTAQRINPDGSNGAVFDLDRFDTMRLTRVTMPEMQRAQRLAQSAGGGFRNPDIFSGLSAAAGAAIKSQR